MKFKVKWKEIVEFQAEIEANSEQEAKEKAYEHDYDAEDGEDIIDTKFEEDSVEITKV